MKQEDVVNFIINKYSAVYNKSIDMISFCGKNGLLLIKVERDHLTVEEAETKIKTIIPLSSFNFIETEVLDRLFV